MKTSAFNKFYAVVTLTTLLTFSAFGQVPKQPENNGGLRTTKENAFGVFLHNRGLGIMYRHGWQKTYKYKNIVDVSLTYIRHPKEVRSYTISFQNNKSYYYGKLNAFWQLRPVFGGRKTLFPKKRDNGAEISWVWGAGFSLGLAKPVYLKVRRLTADGVYIDVEERYNPDEHNVNNIYGGASWFKGIDELKAYPGLHLKTGFYFDFTTRKGFMIGGELGVAADAFLQEIPIMATETNQSIFTLLYLNVFIGKKKF